jgi:hypothetical protein
MREKLEGGIYLLGCRWAHLVSVGAAEHRKALSRPSEHISSLSLEAAKKMTPRSKRTHKELKSTYLLSRGSALIPKRSIKLGYGKIGVLISVEIPSYRLPVSVERNEDIPLSKRHPCGSKRPIRL